MTAAAATAGGGAGLSPPVAVRGFGDLLAERVIGRSSQLVLGLDPDPARLWPGAIEPVAGSSATPGERASQAVLAHCGMVIDAVAEHCVAVKLQVACFERLGAPGWDALRGAAERARSAGLLVIADAKPGDIEVTANAYAQAFLGETPTPFGAVPGLCADAITANPLLGRDSLEPLIRSARNRGGGVFALVRTSNPGAADIQELPLRDGGSVSDRLAAMVAELGADGVGEAGLADVGAVIGATAPDRLAALRQLMPHAILLLPGVGAQGAAVEDLAPAFALGPAGGLVTVSRGVVYAGDRGGGGAATAAAREASRLRELAWRLAA